MLFLLQGRLTARGKLTFKFLFCFHYYGCGLLCREKSLSCVQVLLSQGRVGLRKNKVKEELKFVTHFMANSSKNSVFDSENDGEYLQKKSLFPYFILNVYPVI